MRCYLFALLFFAACTAPAPECLTCFDIPREGMQIDLHSYFEEECIPFEQRFIEGEFGLRSTRAQLIEKWGKPDSSSIIGNRKRLHWGETRWFDFDSVMVLDQLHLPSTPATIFFPQDTFSLGENFHYFIDNFPSHWHLDPLLAIESRLWIPFCGDDHLSERILIGKNVHDVGYIVYFQEDIYSQINY